MVQSGHTNEAFWSVNLKIVLGMLNKRKIDMHISFWAVSTPISGLHAAAKYRDNAKSNVHISIYIANI